jgi:hypothetical protein
MIYILIIPMTCFGDLILKNKTAQLSTWKFNNSGFLIYDK